MFFLLSVSALLPFVVSRVARHSSLLRRFGVLAFASGSRSCCGCARKRKGRGWGRERYAAPRDASEPRRGGAHGKLPSPRRGRWRALVEEAGSSRDVLRVRRRHDVPGACREHLREARRGGGGRRGHAACEARRGVRPREEALFGGVEIFFERAVRRGRESVASRARARDRRASSRPRASSSPPPPPPASRRASRATASREERVAAAARVARSSRHLASAPRRGQRWRKRAR